MYNKKIYQIINKQIINIFLEKRVEYHNNHLIDLQLQDYKIIIFVIVKNKEKFKCVN